MMKEEFERIAGYEVSEQDYHDIIEPMYLATKLNKEEFVKCVNKKRFALRPLKSIVKEMKQIAEHLKDTCTHYIDFDAKDRLQDLVREYVSRRYAGIAAFHVHDEMMFSCYYPTRIEIFNAKTFENYETIKLF